MRQVYPRHCGECRECCIHVGVEELDKKAGVSCKHLCSRGCSIYENRPKGCADFACMWLIGAFGQNDKPSKTGVCCWISYTGIMLDSEGNKVLTLYVSHRKKLSKKIHDWMIAMSYQYPVIQTPVKGNSPRHRTIWWQGKMVTNEVEVRQWYEDSNTS